MHTPHNGTSPAMPVDLIVLRNNADHETESPMTTRETTPAKRC